MSNRTNPLCETHHSFGQWELHKLLTLEERRRLNVSGFVKTSYHPIDQLVAVRLCSICGEAETRRIV